ncbi:MAG: hypothetical protein IPL31_14630 [Saprospiraceae bacterium]|nr:hypothetical protein [Saprospiraceae bacterium]
MKENIDIQEVESYLHDKMTLEERQDFEARMELNETLRKEVEKTIVISKGIKHAAKNDIRQRAEAVRNAYHSNNGFQKPRFNWWMVVGLFMIAGLLWFGYWYFWKSQIAETDKTTPAKSTPIIATQTPTNQDDSLSMTGDSPLFSKLVQFVNNDGKAIGESIQVNIFRDNSLKQIHFLYQNELLNLYLPAGIEFPLPPILIGQGNDRFLKISNEEYLLIESGALQMLNHK